VLVCIFVGVFIFLRLWFQGTLVLGKFHINAWQYGGGYYLNVGRYPFKDTIRQFWMGWYNRGVKEDKTSQMTGILSAEGYKVAERGGPYGLIGDRGLEAYLVTDLLDLSEYVGKRVWIRGRKYKSGNLQYRSGQQNFPNTIFVDKITLLEVTPTPAPTSPGSPMPSPKPTPIPPVEDAALWDYLKTNYSELGILYISDIDGSLFKADVDNQNRHRLSEEGETVFTYDLSPDGETILYTSGVLGKVDNGGNTYGYTYNGIKKVSINDQGREVWLGNREGRYYSILKFSPDGKVLALGEEAIDKTTLNNFDPETNYIWQVEYATQKSTKLAEVPNFGLTGFGGDLRWSHDRKYLAFQDCYQGCKTYILNTITGGKLDVPDVDYDIQWFKDNNILLGGRYAPSYGGEDDSVYFVIPHWESKVLSRTSQKVLQKGTSFIRFSPNSNYRARVLSPSLSNSNGQVAYVEGEVSNWQKGDLYLYNLLEEFDLADGTKLTSDECFVPENIRWSPDDKLLIMTTQRPHLGTWIYSLEKKAKVKISDEAYRSPQFFLK